MDAEIISIGDELLAGLTVNTNASYIAQQLIQAGRPVRHITTVGDIEPDIVAAMHTATGRAGLAIMTGGLGPTHDDISKKAVAGFLDCEMVFHQNILDRIERQFRKFGRTMAPANRMQAEIPEKAEVIPNSAGTAPGLTFRKQNTLFFLLPGVPREMRAMMEKSVLPSLKPLPGASVQRSRRLRTAGIAESELYQHLEAFPGMFPDIRLAFLPGPSGVVMRLVCSGHNADEVGKTLDEGESFIRHHVGQHIYGMDDQRMEDTVAAMLFQQKKTIAVAESCTGGLIAHKLTNVSGSSLYFHCGIVAYSNSAKTALLDVPEEMIIKYGAVSAQTALAMAKGIRQTAKTDIGLSVTGIAGPAGGTPEKPVGLVFIGYADENRAFTEQHHFFRDRDINKERSAQAALNLLRRSLLQVS